MDNPATCKILSQQQQQKKNKISDPKEIAKNKFILALYRQRTWYVTFMVTLSLVKSTPTYSQPFESHAQCVTIGYTKPAREKQLKLKLKSTKLVHHLEHLKTQSMEI